MLGLHCLPSCSVVEELLRCAQIEHTGAGPGFGAARSSTRRLKPRQVLFRSGQVFANVYVVRSGYLKTIYRTEQTDRVLHFPMKYDWIGLDGIGIGQHVCDAIALTHTELLALPFEQLIELTQHSPRLHRAVYEAFSLSQCSHERDADLMAITGAEQRVARFLSIQAYRQAQRGLPETAFNLPMSRRDIGAFLGLTLETVSRALSSLALAGVIRVERRAIHILDRERLDNSLAPHLPRRPHKSDTPAGLLNGQGLGAIAPGLLG